VLIQGAMGETIEREPRRTPRQGQVELAKARYRRSFYPRADFSRFTARQLRVLDLGILYQRVRRERTGQAFYTVFYPARSDPRRTTNWKHISAALAIVDDNGYDWTGFIVAQFEELEGFARCPLPAPRNISSSGAIDRYDRWSMRERQKGLGSRPLTRGEKERERREDGEYARNVIRKANGK